MQSSLGGGSTVPNKKNEPRLSLLILTHLLSAPAAFAAFLLVCYSPLLDSIDLLFIRGCVAALLVFLVQVLLLWIVTVKKVPAGVSVTVAGVVAFQTAASTAALTLMFLVIFPVSIDRSVTIFILNQIAASEKTNASSSKLELERLFVQDYVQNFGAVERRLQEQIRVGNVVKNGEEYVLTPQGKDLLKWSKQVGEIFKTKSELRPK